MTGPGRGPAATRPGGPRQGSSSPLPQRSLETAVLPAPHRHPPVARVRAGAGQRLSPAPRGCFPAPHLTGASRAAGGRLTVPPPPPRPRPRSCPLPGRGGTTCRRLFRAQLGAASRRPPAATSAEGGRRVVEAAVSVRPRPPLPGRGAGPPALTCRPPARGGSGGGSESGRRAPASRRAHPGPARAGPGTGTVPTRGAAGASTPSPPAPLT